MFVGFVTAVVVGGGSAKADFTFGETTNIGAPVNTLYDEEMPSISADGLELYFQSRRPGGYTAFDIWVAKRASLDDTWTEPVNLGPLVNSGKSNWSHGISADGLELYFEAARDGNYGGVDLWVAARQTKDEPWGDPVNLGSTVNSSANDACPNISTDGLELYFRSNRPGGYGYHDIWVCKRPTTEEPWGNPVNLGPTINGPDVEAYPSISADGLALFFNSDRLNGARGWDPDIWLTRRKTKDSPWGEPINLGSSVNTPFNECAPSISADGRTLYFSDYYYWNIRPGGYGGADLYQVSVTPIVDLNGDGTVDSEDKSVLMDHWGKDASLCDIGPMPWGDGIVDIQDLSVLAEYIDVEDVVMVHTPSLHATEVPHDVTLHWLPARIADAHDVYFGTSFEDVYAANRDDPRDVLVSQDQSASTFDPGPLAFGQTYHWRIDEVTATFGPTIYKGLVMDFTTESLAYPLENVSATASTSDASSGPENTVNGSGLNADDTHSTVATDMWLASGNGVDPVWIQYEFDKVYKLHEMLVWNYNVQFELVLGFGLQDVTVEYSQNGTDWTVLGDVELAQATAAPTYTANTTIDLGGVAAKCVRLTVNSGWGMTGKFGLSEVRFYHIPTRARRPEPVDGETAVSPDTILSWHAGREAVFHEVYLSTDRQAVVDGAALIDTVAGNNYLPDPLDLGQTYYWKINEITEAETVSAWEGDVWKFTTLE